MVTAALSSFLLVANAAALDNGASAPDFSLVSGEGQTLALKDIKGRAALVLYETRETKEDNRELKNALNKLYAQNPELGKASLVLSVIDCSGAAWPFKGIWRKELAKNSEKEKITIYGDWDGKMAAAYGMKKDAANVLLLSRKGTALFQSSEKLDAKAQTSLLRQLQNAAAEEVK